MVAGGAREAAQHMDGIYRYQRHIYDATRKFYLLGRDRLIEQLQPPDSGSVLEVACGTGRNLIAAARRYPQARFYGFDISQEMLDTAETAVARAGLAHRIKLAHGDAATFNPDELFGLGSFGRVYISYALSMIPPWREALRTAMRATAPGGELHVVDFGEQLQLPRAFHRGLSIWLARFSVTPRPDLEQVMRDVALEHDASLRFKRLYRDYARYGIIATAEPPRAA